MRKVNAGKREWGQAEQGARLGENTQESGRLGRAEGVILKLNYRHLYFKPFILFVGLVGFFLRGWTDQQKFQRLEHDFNNFSQSLKYSLWSVQSP